MYADYTTCRHGLTCCVCLFLIVGPLSRCSRVHNKAQRWEWGVDRMVWWVRTYVRKRHHTTQYNTTHHNNDRSKSHSWGTNSVGNRGETTSCVSTTLLILMNLYICSAFCLMLRHLTFSRSSSWIAQDQILVSVHGSHREINQERHTMTRHDTNTTQHDIQHNADNVTQYISTGNSDLSRVRGFFLSFFDWLIDIDVQYCTKTNKPPN